MKTFDDIVTEYNNTIKKAWEFVYIIGDKICEALKDIIPDLRWYVDKWEGGVDIIDFASEESDGFYEYLEHKTDYVSLGEIISETFPQFMDKIVASSLVYVPKELVPQIKERLLTLKNSFVEMEYRNERDT